MIAVVVVVHGVVLIHASLYSLIEIIRFATLCTRQEAAIKRKDVRDPTTLLNSIIIFTLCCELCVVCCELSAEYPV